MSEEHIEDFEKEMIENGKCMGEAASIIYPGDPNDKEYAKLVAQGVFSDAEYEWLLRSYTEAHGNPTVDIPPRTDVWMRQNRLQAVKRAERAGITLLLASEMSAAFSQKDWDRIMPDRLLQRIVYRAVFNGGVRSAALLKNALQRGLNDHLENVSKGLMAEVKLSFSAAEDQGTAYSHELSERVASGLLEQLTKK